MPTIRDVAKHAGVAPITVSRVINQKGYFSDGIRQRVEAAIDELGYIPNAIAKSFRWKQTGILALILTDVTNPFWTTVARGVEDAASDQGFNVVLCNTDESVEEQNRYLRALLQKQVDGVLLVPVQSNLDPIRMIQKQNIPVVVLDRRIPEPLADVVRCNAEAGAYEMARLLLANGHRSIAILAGRQGVSTTDDRVAACQRAMQDSGCEPDILYGAFSVESGYALAKEAIGKTPRPTALFACNNFLAIGALKALRDAGLRVPDDISLSGYDDLPAHLVIDPFLSVVSQPAYEMGQRATQLLLERLAGTGNENKMEIVLPTLVVDHGSILNLNPSKDSKSVHFAGPID